MTISGISTAIGEAGIGIVRISGDRAFEIGEEIFRPIDKNIIGKYRPRTFYYGHIYDGEELVDEVLLVFMKGPKTYTREDMVEIHCHGGLIPVRKILNLSLKKGARLAQPGEFTKLAFLNGRLDLSQAEAIMDMIKAKTDLSYQAGLQQLEGSISKDINQLRQSLLNMLAEIELNIDFPDEDYEEISYIELEKEASLILDKLKTLRASSDRGKILREGVKTTILGKPNVGKSSLLNRILREKRAIVTDVPGTTRDTIEEIVSIDGIAIKLVDTAGIRETDDQVENIGVEMARELADKSDLLIAVFDGSKELDKEDEEILRLIKDRTSILLLNKSDLGQILDEEDFKDYIDPEYIISASMTENLGIDRLEDMIKERVFKGELSFEGESIITNIRHIDLLDQSLASMESALEDIKARLPIDLIALDLSNTYTSLGHIIGQSIEEDILNKIFSEFCLGK